MTVDRTPETNPETGKAPPGGKRRTARELYKELDGPVDEHFKQSLATFARRVGERVAQQTPPDPQAAAQARRAALQEFDLARERRVKTALAAGGGTALATAIASLIIFIAAPFDTPSPATASTQPAAPVEVVVVAAPPSPAPPPAAPAPAPAVAPPAPAATGAVAPLVAPAALRLASAIPQPAPPLERGEVREVQTLLRAFGFDPGPIDGAVGRKTHTAVLRYRQERGQPPFADVDRELLEQLRQDPAPKVVTQVAQRPARSYRAQRSSDPFAGLRTAMWRVERWVQSW